MMYIRRKIFKIEYNQTQDGLFCLNVLNNYGVLINQINDDDADYIYNTLVGNPTHCLSSLKNKNKELFNDSLKVRINLNKVIGYKEIKDTIEVETEYSVVSYSKLKLAVFWLTHSNDEFFNTFGFSWVPSIELQEKAREILNNNVNGSIIQPISIPTINVNEILKFEEIKISDYLNNSYKNSVKK